MSSNYSISTSGSSSFCTNPAPNHTQSRHAPSAAAARGERPAEAATASATRQDVTPKKASQSSKAATTTQESPSMTIRRLPTDYSKRMEDQKARSSALERYKMLVKANRLVPSEGEASPDPKKRPEAEEADLSTTWRRSDVLPPSSVHRGDSAVSNTVLSDVSDDDDEAAATAATSGVGNGRKSADPRKPRSVSRRQCRTQGQRERSSPSPVSVSVSVDRPAYPNSTTQRHDDETPAAAMAAAVPSLDLTKTLAHQPTQQPPSATKPSPSRSTLPASDEVEEESVNYVSPELTQPFGKSNLKPRSSLRPGYEPITEHRSASLTRTSSITADGQQQQRTPRKQPTSQVRSHSSVTQNRQGASPTGPSTPRRKSTTKARAAETAASPPPAAAAEKSPVAETTHIDVATMEAGGEHDTENASQPSSKVQSNVVPLPGSKTAFWMRPSSAMYEMTSSIAAKRKDHAEPESATRTNSSRRTSRAYHAIPTGSSSSPCGTPRGTPRGRGADAVVAEEKKPRFSTHMSATDRKLYEESSVAAPPPPVSTYDAIFSQRHSTVQRGSARRSQKAGPGAADALASSVASSTPRGVSSQQQQQRAGQRPNAVRSPSSLSRLSSSQHARTPTEEPAAESGRVSTRQQDALSKHCARVAARGAAGAEAPPALASAPAGAANAAVAVKAANNAKKTGPVVAALGQRTTPSAAPQPKHLAAPSQPSQEVHKRLEYEATEVEEEDEEGDEPAPLTVVPHSTKRNVGGTAAPSRRHAAANEEGEEEAEEAEASPHTTIHGSRAGNDATPSKSRRREHDTTASPPRDDGNNDDATYFAEQDAVMAREKAAARAQQARDALESCRLARQARVEATRTTHSAGGPVSTNEVVAAMLQGIVQQTRQVLPCYLCGELQSTSGYRVHVSACRPVTEGILREYFTTVGGQADTPADVKQQIERLAALEVPLSTSDLAVRDAFAKECYQCVKASLVPCRKCGTQLRVQDVKEHEMLCGRAYYQNSRAAERVRSAVDRITHGSQD